MLRPAAKAAATAGRMPALPGQKLRPFPPPSVPTFVKFMRFCKTPPFPSTFIALSRQRSTRSQRNDHAPAVTHVFIAQRENDEFRSNQSPRPLVAPTCPPKRLAATDQSAEALAEAEESSAFGLFQPASGSFRVFQAISGSPRIIFPVMPPPAS